MRRQDEKSREARLEKIAENVHVRRLYAAEQVEAVIPRPMEDPIPKVRVFTLAMDHAVADGLKDQSFFDGNAGRFLTYLTRNWSDIRAVLRDDLGVHVEYGHGLPGIRRAGKRGLKKTLDWQLRSVEASARTYNEVVEAARPILPAPMVQLKLLLSK